MAIFISSSAVDASRNSNGAGDAALTANAPVYASQSAAFGCDGAKHSSR